MKLNHPNQAFISINIQQQIDKETIAFIIYENMKVNQEISCSIVLV